MTKFSNSSNFSALPKEWADVEIQTFVFQNMWSLYFYCKLVNYLVDIFFWINNLQKKGISFVNQMYNHFKTLHIMYYTKKLKNSKMWSLNMFENLKKSEFELINIKRKMGVSMLSESLCFCMLLVFLIYRILSDILT